MLKVCLKVMCTYVKKIPSHSMFFALSMLKQQAKNPSPSKKVKVTIGINKIWFRQNVCYMSVLNSSKTSTLQILMQSFNNDNFM